MIANDDDVLNSTMIQNRFVWISDVADGRTDFYAKRHKNWNLWRKNIRENVMHVLHKRYDFWALFQFFYFNFAMKISNFVFEIGISAIYLLKYLQFGVFLFVQSNIASN